MATKLKASLDATARYRTGVSTSGATPIRCGRARGSDAGGPAYGAAFRRAGANHCFTEGGGDRNAIPIYKFPMSHVVHHFIPAMPLRISALRSLGAYHNVFFDRELHG